MPVAFIPFNAFSPGGSSFGDQLSDALNVLPLYGGYFPIREKVVGNEVTDSPVTGCFAHTFPSGIGSAAYQGDAATIFAGTPTKLYDTAANPWTNLSRGGGYGAATFPGSWHFASFGNDVWATNGIDPTQRRTNNAGSFADGITSTFKPAGRFLGVVREFMIQASLSNAARFADEFCWSDSNDATWYDDRTGTRTASLAGSKRIVSRPGQLTGFVGGEFGIFFKRRSIHALQFTGGADVWRLDEISHGIGCAFPSSLIAGEDANYFFSGRGFYSQSGLYPPVKISPPEIDQLFTDGVHFGRQGFYHGSLATMAQEDDVIVGVEDWKSGLKFWFYSAGFAVGKQSTPLDAALVYDPQSQLWSRLAPLGGDDYSINRLTAYPENGTEQTSVETVRLVLFTDEGGGVSARCGFSGQHAQATLKTQRQPISFPDLTPTGRCRINGVLPIFTVPDVQAWSEFPVPVAVPNISITFRAANDPQFTSLADAAGTVISPRSEAYAVTDANEWGWFPHSIEGRLWDITVVIPEGGEWRNFTGVWVAVEEIP